MLDTQLTSMKAYNPAGFGQDPGLHFITQRYALLTTSLLLLNADYQVDISSYYLSRACRPSTAMHAIKFVQCEMAGADCSGRTETTLKFRWILISSHVAASTELLRILTRYCTPA